MTEFYRPTIRQVIVAVAEEFNVGEALILSSHQSKLVWRAKSAAAMISVEQGHTVMSIARALGRDHSTIHSNVMTGRVTLRRDTWFRAQVCAVRAKLHASRLQKPLSDEEVYRQKLERHRAEILKLRHLYGTDRGWSDRSLARHFGIPVHIIAPVIGVYRVERG